MPKKRSFFERLTGSINLSEQEEAPEKLSISSSKEKDWIADDEPVIDDEGGQLAVDVYQTADDIIIKTMVAGVRPEDLDIAITRDMVTIKGTRETASDISDDNYFFRELYWGSFVRSIVLPQEIEVEGAEAIGKHGLLIIKLPKVDKGRQTKLRVKMA